MDNYLISRAGIADILRGKSIDTEPDVKHVAVEIHKYLRSIDAVPVVRCRDCKWWGDDDHPSTDEIKYCQLGRYMVGENGYCVYAARMDGESEEER